MNEKVKKNKNNEITEHITKSVKHKELRENQCLLEAAAGSHFKYNSTGQIGD